MLINKLNWVSGRKAESGELENLNKKMSDFYSQMSSRQAYQEIIDDAHDFDSDPTAKLANLVVRHIVELGVKNVLEIGCGSGKIYKGLRKSNYKGRYTGIEMAEPVIENNKILYPDASWYTGSVYDDNNRGTQFDCCLAFFVLEHLIFPEKALKTMLDSLQSGGYLMLVFPDFCHTGIFPSQKVGLTFPVSSKEKLKKLRIADAFVTYFEGRMMRKRLKNLNQYYGPFVINVNPYCLSNECKQLIPDIDAVYLSNKTELENWAKEMGHEAYFPDGKEGLLASQSFIVIKK
jgi:2-polyprenyl-3-methyl-5-hydroxy-6-metoxy-1,4-benzoquinol methylase